MPLTPYQAVLAQLLSRNRTEDSHLAGGAALHASENSIRFSEDLDYFHDSEARVASAYDKDRKLLEKNGYKCSVEMNQPGYIRCLVAKNGHSTKVEWAHDSAWRFMPVEKVEALGYVLHPIDLAINKILALAGRDEARDFLDVLHAHETLLPLGALCWAACGKDPGWSPNSLLELLKRRGKYQPEDFKRLNLNIEVNLQHLKQTWLAAMGNAELFIQQAPPQDVGCLYYSQSKKTFVSPDFSKPDLDITPHTGRPGGVVPLLKG